MVKYREIYEEMLSGYELINRIDDYEQATKIHQALVSRFYNKFSNVKEEEVYYKTEMEKGPIFKSSNNPNDYLRKIGISSKNIDIGILFTLFSSQEIKESEDFAKYITKQDSIMGTNYFELLSDKVKETTDIVNNYVKRNAWLGNSIFDRFFNLPIKSQESKSVILYVLKLEKEENPIHYIDRVYNRLFSSRGSYQNRQPDIVNNWLEDEKFIKDLCKIEPGFIDYVCDGAIAQTKQNKSSQFAKK